MSATPSSVITLGYAVTGATPSLVITLGYGNAVAPTTAAITGTVAGAATEAQIRAGGLTLLITLTNDTWVAAGASFNAQRQNIINGLNSAQSEANGWNTRIRGAEVVSAVVRTSDTVVTITLSAAPSYDINSLETITVTVPSSALVTSLSAVVASPTFDITPVAVTGGGGAGTWQRIKPGSGRDARGEHSQPSGVPVRYRQEIDQETPPEVIDVVNAKAEAEALARAIIEQRREISRIKTQMRVSTNREALKVMEAEIEKLELDLSRTKREAEELLLLTILM